jgi:diamine N-acetyltransferase
MEFRSSEAAVLARSLCRRGYSHDTGWVVLAATSLAAGSAASLCYQQHRRCISNSPPAEVELREVCEANYNAIIRLAVWPRQQELVASNAVTLAQAAYEPMSWLRAIYSRQHKSSCEGVCGCSGDLVGLLLLSMPPGPWPNYLSRLMVDHRFQRRGFGAASMRCLVEELRAVSCPSLHVTYSTARGGAHSFYRRLGFVESASPSNDDEAEAVLHISRPDHASRSDRAVPVQIATSPQLTPGDTHRSWSRCKSLLQMIVLLLSVSSGGSQNVCNSATGLVNPLKQCATPPAITCRENSSILHVFDGLGDRPYCLHVPSPRTRMNRSGTFVDAALPVPLIIFLHDAGATIEQVYEHTSLLQTSRLSGVFGPAGYALALPQARGVVTHPGATCVTGWDYLHRNFSNGRRCADCSMGNLSSNLDVATVDRIINDAVDAGLVDPTRIYIAGWGVGGFFGQMYSIARAIAAWSVQPSGTCVAAATVYSAGDPFNHIAMGDHCALDPYPRRSVPVMVTSRACDTVCCDAHAQPYCPGRQRPGWDLPQWVADARNKMNLSLRWDLLNVSSIVRSNARGGVCLHSCDSVEAKQGHAQWPREREMAMLSFLASHTSSTLCWDQL